MASIALFFLLAAALACFIASAVMTPDKVFRVAFIGWACLVVAEMLGAHAHMP